MYSYARHSSRLFRHIPLKNANLPKKCKFNFVNKSFYSNILDNRLKSSLESVRFIKSVNNICVFPRYDHINTFLNKYNVSFATQSVNLSTSSNTIEVASEDQVTGTFLLTHILTHTYYSPTLIILLFRNDRRGNVGGG